MLFVWVLIFYLYKFSNGLVIKDIGQQTDKLFLQLLPEYEVSFVG